MFIALHKKYTFVKNVIMSITKIKFHQNMIEKLSKMILFWTLDFVTVIVKIEMNFFVRFVTYQCV